MTKPAGNAAAVARWSDALTQFEERLIEFRSVLDGTGGSVAGLWPPPDVIDVPLPREHAERARRLLGQAKELEGRIIARRDELPTPRSQSRPRRTRPHASFQADL